MYRIAICLIVSIIEGGGRKLACKNPKTALEIGKWAHNLKHLDSAVIENGPVSMHEGQMYVYENYFPNYIIKYVHVDNVAIKSCGANAQVKKGGVDASSVLIVLHADINEEIRSVIDIWGTANGVPAKGVASHPEHYKGGMKSIYLFSDRRAVNHNTGFRKNR
ncbi:uncharacterized protein LOC123723483 [Papilio machaon]|uniref:uncharacterized protein LOC123723483 n=1 Tax=Papilio machaon TaxID=76193 RepID=UPI001E6651AB|nr:uncharacterized protein LOC123723483 [Papilio machaon]